jgi:5-methylcytosine-specific restriction protein A
MGGVLCGDNPTWLWHSEHMSPMKAQRPCSHPGCPELISFGSRCEAHRRQSQSLQTARRMERPELKRDKAFYDSALWRRVRMEVLRQEPWCRACKAAGRATLADMVDHIVRIQDNGERLARANLQALCSVCHNAKRGRESRDNRRSDV